MERRRRATGGARRTADPDWPKNSRIKGNLFTKVETRLMVSRIHASMITKCKVQQFLVWEGAENGRERKNLVQWAARTVEQLGWWTGDRADLRLLSLRYLVWEWIGGV